MFIINVAFFKIDQFLEVWMVVVVALHTENNWFLFSGSKHTLQYAHLYSLPTLPLGSHGSRGSFKPFHHWRNWGRKCPHYSVRQLEDRLDDQSR